MAKAALQFEPVNQKERAKLDLRSGDTVKVSLRIQEKGKIRLQVFEGLVLAVKHGKEAGATFTVRRTASGVGVEKIFPLNSPIIEKIAISKRSNVRRSKLYHIRKKAAKEIKRQMKYTHYVEEEGHEEEAQAPEVKAEETVEVAAE